NVEKEPVIVEKTEGNVEKLVQESVNEIPFEVIGQLHGSYILASNVDGLVIIDQHAANERIRYEEVRKALEESQIAVQPLLMPYVISISRSMMLHYEQLEASMQTLGFTIDRFGETEILVREVPLWMQVENEERFILDLLERMEDNKKNDITLLKKDALATLACHTSVRFNHNLSKEEMEETIRRLMKCENPYHCPHGRPTYIVYEDSKLRKLFERG
ncbi:MAG: DNA mismatch repair protein MutL, partial [Erysipelotrichales bacterium]|nr:DNA mismatch repair protein MutL [Erysipelotrichales bacterium]